MEESPPLPELPWDVWVNILSRLPMISIQQVRSVCKGWRLLLAHPHFTEVHSKRSEQYPALLYFNYSTRCLTHVEIIRDGSNGGGDTTTTTNDTPSNIATAVMKLKVEDYPLNPVATCNGVVCFSCRSDKGFTGNTSYYVGNPLVDRVQDFARAEELTRNPHEAYWIGGFGLSLKTKRYKIVGFYFSAYWGVEVADKINVKICTICPRRKRQDSWRKFGSFPRRGRSLSPSRMIGSYLDGGIHWLLVSDRRRRPALISRLDLDSEQFELLPTPESMDFQLEAASKRMRLGVSGGHLIMICAHWSINDDWYRHTTGGLITWIWVRMKESWIKKFVVKGPPAAGFAWWQIDDFRVLNYGPQDGEAAGRREATEVVLFYLRTARIFACWVEGHCVTVTGRRYVRYVPSLVSTSEETGGMKNDEPCPIFSHLTKGGADVKRVKRKFDVSDETLEKKNWRQASPYIQACFAKLNQISNQADDFELLHEPFVDDSMPYGRLRRHMHFWAMRKTMGDPGHESPGLYCAVVYVWDVVGEECHVVGCVLLKKDCPDGAGCCSAETLAKCLDELDELNELDDLPDEVDYGELCERVRGSSRKREEMRRAKEQSEFDEYMARVTTDKKI